MKEFDNREAYQDEYYGNNAFNANSVLGLVSSGFMTNR